MEIIEEESEIRNELGSERADALSQTTSDLAQEESTQPSNCAEVQGLLRLFSNLRRETLFP